MYKKIVSLVTVIVLLLTQFPFTPVKSAEPEVVNMDVTVYAAVYSDYALLEWGSKGVDCSINSFKIQPQAGFEMAPQDDLKEIKVIVNGTLDETNKFDVNYDAASITLDLKQVYRLRETSLYNVYIPQGMFQNPQNGAVNKAINFSFVTGSSDFIVDDILVKTTPKKDASGVDCNTNRIELEFVDDIETDLQTIKNKITLTTTPVSPGIPSYYDDSIHNYNVRVEENKLVLENNNGETLSDFAVYEITLESGAVRLKDSPEADITNDYHTITFTTDKIIQATSPENNQHNVELEPTICFDFKYPIQILDKSLISFYAGEEAVVIDDNNINAVEDKLMIEIDDHQDCYPLRKNTLYKVVIDQGAVRFKDYPSIINPPIQLSFITGDEGQSPVVTKFASNPQGSDDITSISDTELDPGDSIFVHFDRDIRWDKHASEVNPVQGIELFKIPGASKTDYDESGEKYDSLYIYNSDGSSLVKEEGVQIKTAVITDGNILKITPENPLIPLNEYRIRVDKEFIEDSNGINIINDINTYIWTAPSSTPLEAEWIGIQTHEGDEQLFEDSGAPYKDYTLFGAPVYNGSNPMVLLVEGEVIKEAGDDQALQGISLVEGYDTEVKLNFNEYRLEYYFAAGKKHTKILLYPALELEHGKYYKLNVAGDVFHTRSGNYLEPLELRFVTSCDENQPKGIYTLENSVIKVTDFKDKEVSFTIKGFNFNEQIDHISLSPVSGKAAQYGYSIVIDGDDVVFENPTLLRVKLRGKTAQLLAQESYTGEYQVEVFFDDGSSYQQVDSGDNYLEVLSKGRPVVKDKYPDNTRLYDEKSLNPKVVDGDIRYFLKITFEDLDGELTFNQINGLSLLNTSTVYAEGGSQVSLIDSEFIYFIENLDDSARDQYISKYIFNKNRALGEAYLYVPVKPLRADTKYTVTINSGIVYFSDITDEESGNNMIQWTFSTMTHPEISSISLGSVGEDYDEDEPIIIKGNFFNEDSIRVFFNDTEAEDVRVIQNKATQQTYLKVYLPDGRDRLDPGIYTITVQNDANHSREIFGSFSVVEEGSYLPQEGSITVKKDAVGEVIADIDKSTNTIMLKSRYTDEDHLELDLDELMGENVLVRRIKFEGDRKDRIKALVTKSKWADIIIYGLTLASSADEDEVTLDLGRAEPLVVESINKKLRGLAVKSRFIQIDGENFDMDKALVVIPFKYSDGTNLAALRYDLKTRAWVETPCFVDRVNGNVKVMSEKPGIFVVVEQGVIR